MRWVDIWRFATEEHMAKWWGIAAFMLIAATVVTLGIGLFLVLRGRPADYLATMGTVVNVRVEGPAESKRYPTTIRVSIDSQNIEFDSDYGHKDALNETVSVYFHPTDPAGTMETDTDRFNEEWLWLGLAIVAGLVSLPFYGIWKRTSTSPSTPQTE